MSAETNVWGQTLCAWSDLPVMMCSHCQHGQTETKTRIPTVTTQTILEHATGHQLPQYRVRIKSEPLTCPHPHPHTQPLCEACMSEKSSHYVGTPNHPLQQLAEIPDLAADVEATRNHKNPAGHHHTRTTTPAPKVPADLETLDCLRTDSKGLLHKLQQALTEITDTANPDTTWAGVCEQLRRSHRQWENNPDTRYAIHTVHTRLRIAARIPAPLQLACPRCNAPIRLQPGGQYYLCDAGHEINHWAEIDRMARLTLYATPITLAQASIEYATPLWTLKRLLRDIPSVGKAGNARTWEREKIETKLTEYARKQAA